VLPSATVSLPASARCSRRRSDRIEASGRTHGRTVPLAAADSAAATKFNAAAKKIVVSANDDYKKSLADFSAEDIKSLPASIGLSNEVGYDVALANNEIKGTKIDRTNLDKVLGSDTGLIASILNRQPNATESDGFTRSGDGLALILASPAFQHC